MSLLILTGSLLAAGVGAAPSDPSKLKGLALGEFVFLSYCAGCHGFDGMAFFPSAPSFAMGDRLAQGDAELLRSIRKGRDLMPSWEDKLPDEWLVEALGYIRHVAKPGNSSRINMPDYFYIFTPMGSDMNLDWTVEIP